MEHRNGLSHNAVLLLEGEDSPYETWKAQIGSDFTTVYGCLPVRRGLVRLLNTPWPSANHSGLRCAELQYELSYS